MLRSIMIGTVAMIYVVSCKTGTSPKDSNLENAMIDNGTPFKGALTCNGQDDSSLVTFSNGTANLKLGNDKMDLTCNGQKSHVSSIGRQLIGQCFSSDNMYSIDIFFTSGVTTSYDASVQHDASELVNMNCVQSPNDVPDGSIQTLSQCPQVENINCMPITTEPNCSASRRKWIKQNCPNIKFLD
jgi:hypothetical protein